MNTIVKSALGATALTLCTFVHAQSAYIGLGVGASELNVDCAGTISCDSKDTGFKAFGGYRFLPNLAGEIVYLGFGKAKASQRINATLVSSEWKTTAMGAGLALIGDLGPNWTGVARLGVARVKAEITASGGGTRASVNDTSTQAYFGVGVGYRVTPSLSVDLSADFSRSRIVGETGSISMIGVGATFNF